VTHLELVAAVGAVAIGQKGKARQRPACESAGSGDRIPRGAGERPERLAEPLTDFLAVPSRDQVDFPQAGDRHVAGG
jgi:hypothetical protein